MNIPFYKTLRFRLISSVVVIEVIMLSILVFNNLNAIYLAHTQRLNDTAESTLQQFSRSAATYMAKVDYAELNEYSHRIIENNEISYIKVFTSDKNEVIRVGREIPKYSASIDKHPSEVDDNRFDVKSDILLAGRTLGHIEMGFSLDVMNGAVNSSRNRSILIALTEIFLSIAVTIFIGMRLTNNLHGLSQAALQVGKGKLNIHLPVKTKDEIGQASEAFNEMVQQLYHYRYEMEELIKERTAELEDANKELETFNYSVSHDLRSPLRAIAGFSEILQEDYADKLDEMGLDYLIRIQDGASKMEVLINDILELSRAKRKELQIEEVDLSLVVLELLDRLTYTGSQRHVERKIQEGLSCQCDRGLFIIVMENLIGNAWKYTGKKEKAVIEFGHYIKDGEDVFFVKDNGAGFDMKHAGKLFEPFKRLHGESEFIGTGVGLATVARVIKRHNGRIWAEAEVGKGSTFYFTLESEKNESENVISFR